MKEKVDHKDKIESFLERKYIPMSDEMMGRHYDNNNGYPDLETLKDKNGFLNGAKTE